MPGAKINFEDWVKGIFDHPEGAEPWYYDYKKQTPSLAPAVSVDYLRKLFAGSGELLAGYSNRQLKDGLWYIFDSGNSNEVVSLIDPAVPPAEKLKTIESIYSLYENCFLERCTSALSHLNEAAENPLNVFCYMLWDVAPLPAVAGKKDNPGIDVACLDVMRKGLLLQNDACRESALHGLGHAWFYYPAEVRAIIAPFLAASALRPELRRYAEAALEGRVQ